MIDFAEVKSSLVYKGNRGNAQDDSHPPRSCWGRTVESRCEMNGLSAMVPAGTPGSDSLYNSHTKENGRSDPIEPSSWSTMVLTLKIRMAVTR